MPTAAQQAEAIRRLGGFHPNLDAYLVNVLTGQTVQQRATDLTVLLDYLGVLGPQTHPAPRA